MSRGGCSDHGLAGRVLCAEYRLPHACVLSSTDRSQRALRSRKRRSISQGWIQVQKVVWSPEAWESDSPRRPPRSCFCCTCCCSATLSHWSRQQPSQHESVCGVGHLSKWSSQIWRSLLVNATIRKISLLHRVDWISGRQTSQKSRIWYRAFSSITICRYKCTWTCKNVCGKKTEVGILVDFWGMMQFSRPTIQNLEKWNSLDGSWRFFILHWSSHLYFFGP